MKMKMGKKQYILAVLILALGTAVFLNWRLSSFSHNNTAGTLSTSKSSAALSQKAVKTAVNDTFYAAARLTREQTEGQANELLQTIITDNTTNNTDEQSAQSNIQAVCANITDEESVEKAIESQGFQDCLVIIENGTVSVVVRPKYGDTLSADDVSQIANIIVQQTNVPADNIIIIQHQ